MNINEEYWYRKGIEDFANFFQDMLPEKDRVTFIPLLNAVTNQLMRNFKLIQEILKAEGKK